MNIIQGVVVKNKWHSNYCRKYDGFLLSYIGQPNLLKISKLQCY